MNAERRRRRAEDPLQAMGLFLESLATRLASRSIVVADDDGLLIGGVGTDDLEALAALGAPAVSATTVHERVFEYAESRLRLFLVGGHEPPVDETRDALGRILAVA